MEEVLGTLIPVFGVVGLGWLLSASKRYPTEELGRLAISVTSPAFVFTLLTRTELSAREGALLVGGTVWAIGLGVTVAALCVRRSAAERRGSVLCVGFWNSGNLAMSCSALAFGAAGLEASAVVFVTVLSLQSTLGIWIASGRGGAGELLRAPLFWATVLGLLTRGLGWEAGPWIMTPLKMVGDITIPLMLLTLGGQLRTLEVRSIGPSLRAVALRLLVGGIAMGSFVVVFDVVGVTRSVLLLNAAMPAAVLNVALSQRYDAAPELVASTTVLGTITTACILPFVVAALT